MLFATPVYAGAAAETLGKGGPGYAIVQLMVIAAFGSMAGYITSALGKGQIASMIKLITVFACIGTVLGSVWSAISKVANFFGIGL